MNDYSTSAVPCMICGEPGGHGNLPCPRMQPGTPQQLGRYQFWPDDSDRLRRIEEKLDRLLSREGSGK